MKPEGRAAEGPGAATLVRRAAVCFAPSLLLLLSCQPAASSTPTPAPSAQPPKQRVQAPVEEQPQAMPRPEGTLVQFDDELAHLVEVRGLDQKRPVEGMTLSPDQLLGHLQNALHFERPPEVLKGTERMLVGLGLVPATFDFEATLLALLTENLAGLYEPRLNLMLIREDLPEVLRVITLRHELVHALQDQHFDLEEIVRSTPDDSDRSSALSCLAEGDATSTMLDGLLPGGRTALDVPETEILAQLFSNAPQSPAPPLIVKSLYAPYVDGLFFVHRLRRRGGFAAVDQVWRRPPVSTEQVLHLDKYDAAEPPRDVAVLAPPNGSASLLLHDVWGEQSLRLALEEWSGLPGTKGSTRDAAAGWGGDRIVAYQWERGQAVGWHVVMDSAQDGRELFDFLLLAAGGEASVQSERRGSEWSSGCLALGSSSAVGFAHFREQLVLLAVTESDKDSCSLAQEWWMTLEPQLTQVPAGD